MTMTIKSYILLGTLQYVDYMIYLGQPIPKCIILNVHVPTPLGTP